MLDKEVLKNDEGNQESLLPLFNQFNSDFSSEFLKEKRMYVSHQVIDSNIASSYGVFFIAPTSLRIIQALCCFSVAGTDAGAVTLTIEKLINTQASGTGVNVLSSSFDLKGVINTTQFAIPVLATIPKNLKRGDRLGLVLSGVPTSVNNVIIGIEYAYESQY